MYPDKSCSYLQQLLVHEYKNLNLRILTKVFKPLEFFSSHNHKLMYFIGILCNAKTQIREEL